MTEVQQKLTENGKPEMVVREIDHGGVEQQEPSTMEGLTTRDVQRTVVLNRRRLLA
ncbi:hypothetical protein SESBI_39243 [Sesbania bispinosa]|nr:hypothetical protein SESBI_39243 [Sesbania bispinosa]